MAHLQWKVGDVRITRLVEVEVPLPPTSFFPKATEEALAPYRSWLVPDFLTEEGMIRLSIHALVVETARHRIVVDTCVGEHPVPGFEMLAAGEQTFLQELEEIGSPADRVDYVLCTHLHFDHVGWNTRKVDGRFVPTFANARYLFARKEWEHWKDTESEYTPSFNDAVRPVVDAGLADLVETDHRVCDEVSLVPTHGHTPGHVSILIESQGQRALITGDATHHPVQWAEPDWGMGADSDGPAAAVTRKAMRAVYGNDPTLIIGTHYAGCTAGHIVEQTEGWIFSPQR